MLFQFANLVNKLELVVLSGSVFVWFGSFSMKIYSPVPFMKFRPVAWKDLSENFANKV